MKRLTIALASLFVLGLSSNLMAADMKKDMSMHTKKMMHPPFGTKEDVDFANDMWKKISKAGFLGVHGHLYVGGPLLRKNRRYQCLFVHGHLYVGGPPHGKVREVVEGIVDNKLVIVKSNYGGKDVSIENVKNNPKKYLKAVTVMVKRDG